MHTDCLIHATHRFAVTRTLLCPLVQVSVHISVIPPETGVENLVRKVKRVNKTDRFLPAKASYITVEPLIKGCTPLMK